MLSRGGLRAAPPRGGLRTHARARARRVRVRARAHTHVHACARDFSDREDMPRASILNFNYERSSKRVAIGWSMRFTNYF